MFCFKAKKLAKSLIRTFHSPARAHWLCRFEILLLLSAVFLSPLSAHGKPLAVHTKQLVCLETLQSKNVIFRQFCEEIEENGKSLSRGEFPALSFFTYTANADDDLLSLAARTSLPYETIATLNSLSSTTEDLSGRTLILPTAPGLFLCENPDNAWQLLLKKGRAPNEHSLYYTIDEKQFVFLPSERFTPTERSFFLDTTMRLPLDKKQLTSNYGYRVSPISGNWKFHSGIDLAAPSGSSVYACKAGQVTEVSYNATYGNYIIILHNGGMTSVYAHLSKTDVKTGQKVYGGLKIGEVGSTGASTGPHLHFEVRINGKTTDPERLLSVH